MRIRLIAIFLLLSFATLAMAQSDEINRGLWQADWITSPTAPQRDAAVLHFKKVVDLATAPEHFPVRVSADNQFVLFVNQQEVGRGPAHSDLSHWKYETYDLARFLHAGQNVIAATVWNFGVLTELAQMSDRTAFVLDGDDKSVNTDETWQVETDKGLAPLAKPHDMQWFYYAAEPGERIDGAAWDWSWNDALFGTAWTKAVSLGRAAPRGVPLQNVNWQLVADNLPAMDMQEQAGGRVVRVSGIGDAGGFPERVLDIPAHTKATILLDNSVLTTAYPELTVSGGGGSTVRVTYSEALYDAKGGKGNRNDIAGKHIVGIQDEFVPGGGQQRRFSPLAWRTWRYVQLDIETGDQPLTLDNFRSRFTAFPFRQQAQFESNDPSLAKIWEIGWRTARLDAHDTYMDTPYWERLQYVGDTRIQALLSYTVAGDDRLARQAIQAFDNSRFSDGLTQSRYPSAVEQIIPPFSLLWVGMVHDFWMYRDDEQFVRAQLPGARTVLDWFLARQRQDGFLGKIDWWPFVDWAKDFSFGDPPMDANGESSIITMQFVEALRYAAELESAYGDAARAQRYREAAERAVAGIRERCWNAEYGLLADTPAQKHFSQHANILGVWLDVIPREKQKDVLTKILSASDAGFAASGPVPPMTLATYYFRFYLARALDHAGMGDDYLRLLQPWHDMMAEGLTTWAEQPEPTRSDSHAWSAHPNYDLLTIVAGVRPAAPGFAKVSIMPHLGALKNVNAAVPTPKGLIEAKYAVTASGVKAEITLPAGMSGQLTWKGKSLSLHSGEQTLTLP
jgi:alpha-L-rhamnosidase